MPELPEVSTTVAGLKHVLLGLTIRDFWTDWPKMIRPIANARTSGDTKAFRKTVIGEKVTGVTRRAKNILIHLSHNKTVIIHMKMTGHLLYGKFKNGEKKWQPDEPGALNDPYNRFLHFVFSFSNGKHLAFSDMRKFGTIALWPTDDLEQSPYLAHLGPEPLERGFTLARFKERLLAKRNGKIKPVLMDQAVIAGIGNIYSDEMLYLAGIHPERTVGALRDIELRSLFAAMKLVLKKGIDFGGDSTSDYRNIKGERGAFQAEHSAYRMTGKPCGKRGCGGIISRKVVAGRSAHYCPVHQPLRRPA